MSDVQKTARPLADVVREIQRFARPDFDDAELDFSARETTEALVRAGDCPMSAEESARVRSAMAAYSAEHRGAL